VTVKTWDDLVADLAAPWQLDTARELDQRMTVAQTHSGTPALFL